MSIPSVARNDPHFDPETLWRGPVWVNINYFFIEALRQVGEHDLARALTEKTLDLVMSQPSIYEYYNSETGEPPTTLLAGLRLFLLIWRFKPAKRRESNVERCADRTSGDD